MAVGRLARGVGPVRHGPLTLYLPAASAGWPDHLSPSLSHAARVKKVSLTCLSFAPGPNPRRSRRSPTVVSQHADLIGQGKMIYPEYSAEVTWFPCYLNLIHQFPGVWEVRPGLTSGPISDSEKVTLRQFSGLPGVKEPFEPNFLVTVDERTYLTGLAERFGVELHVLEESLTLKTKDSSHRIRIIPDDLFRWLLASLYLCYDLEIYLPSFRYQFRHEMDSLVPSGSGPTHAGFQRSIYTNVRLHEDLTSPIDFDTVERIAAATEIYYRPLDWQYDQVSIALSCFWSSIYSLFPDQAYTILTTILEALLSTGTVGISHQIAELVVLLIGREQDKKIDLYKRIKKLYNLRSRINHGDLRFKKEVINWNSSIISAKTTIISIPELTKLAQVATAVLRSVLEDASLVAALRQPNPDRRRKDMNDYFLKLRKRSVFRS
jgi:hypothetical protein